MQNLQVDEKFTVQDYMNWPDDIRCELIDGEIYDMSPAPLIIHQDISMKLGSKLFTFIENLQRIEPEEKQKCRVFQSPIDVVLNHNSVVQPDIIIVCDEQKLANGKYVDGAPDAVIEILSKSTAVKDRREKKALFEASGVNEYLMIDPEENYAEYFVLDEQRKYGAGSILGLEDEITFQCLPEFCVQLKSLT